MKKKIRILKTRLMEMLIKTKTNKEERIKVTTGIMGRSKTAQTEMMVKTATVKIVQMEILIKARIVMGHRRQMGIRMSKAILGMETAETAAENRSKEQ
jgi:hypothetical protein